MTDQSAHEQGLEFPRDLVSSEGVAAGPDILLVTCVKSKRPHPSAAKDLYTSPLFRKQRAYAERTGVPWYVLSAEHGLVAPDEWLAPYERYLPDTPQAYQSAWGAWVAARLDLVVGPLVGKAIEVHAGSRYLGAIRPPLEARGAQVLNPLDGLSMGERLAWYGPIQAASTVDETADDGVVERLLAESTAESPETFLAAGSSVANRPGLYSWWVDEAGAEDLSQGLGLPVRAGLIYAGLAGATRWPSGTRSQATLWLRIATMHLAGRHEFSTFRRTLGAILAAASESTRVNEDEVSLWMRDHLRVVTVPYDDRDELGRLETRVLKILDPPLNLQGMESSPVRRQLKTLRAVVSKDNR